MNETFREVCARCRRPASVCYCRFVSSIPTKTRVVLLQHPRERDVPIGTARIAALALPNSELHVGVRWSGTRVLESLIADRERPAVLLYPGPGAIDVVAHPPKTPVTLVVVDGTWPQAKKVVRENSELAALPRYAFTPPAPSDYRIRREPSESYVSTIEALAQVLGALEGDFAKFDALLSPFRAMVDMQVACATTIRAGRKRKPKPKKERRLPVPSVVIERPESVVCVVGEANAWPYRSKERETEYPDELIQWTALRLGTGEVFERMIRPRNPLAERTPTHIGIDAETILAGGSVDAFRHDWGAFLREGDVVCAWGHHGIRMLSEVGAPVPPYIDVRAIARDVFLGTVGTAEELADRLGLTLSANSAHGRAASRLARIDAITRELARIARGS